MFNHPNLSFCFINSCKIVFKKQSQPLIKTLKSQCREECRLSSCIFCHMYVWLYFIHFIRWSQQFLTHVGKFTALGKYEQIWKGRNRYFRVFSRKKLKHELQYNLCSCNLCLHHVALWNRNLSASFWKRTKKRSDRDICSEKKSRRRSGHRKHSKPKPPRRE